MQSCFETHPFILIPFAAWQTTCNNTDTFARVTSQEASYGNSQPWLLAQWLWCTFVYMTKAQSGLVRLLRLDPRFNPQQPAVDCWLGGHGVYPTKSRNRAHPAVKPGPQFFSPQHPTAPCPPLQPAPYETQKSTIDQPPPAETAGEAFVKARADELHSAAVPSKM